MQSHDWAQTPVGPIEHWPAALRSWVRFLEALADPSFLIWGEAQTVLFNRPFGALIEPNATALIGASLPELWPTRRRQLARIRARLRAREAGTLRELPWPDTDGTGPPRFVDVAYTPIEDDGGTLLGALCVVHDRTEHVRSRSAMISDLDRLEELFEKAPSFLAIMEGPDHRYVLSNPANNRLLGRDNVVGKTVAEAVPELKSQGILAVLDRVYRTGEPFVGSETPFATGIGEARTVRYLDFIYQPMRNSEGTVVGIFAEGHDVTGHWQAKERIRSLQVELLAHTRTTAMNTMASALAHELNQPLTAIANYLTGAQRIAAACDTEPALLGALESAVAASWRAGQIIRKLREMTLTGRVSKTCFDLAPMIREAVATALAGQGNATVRYALGWKGSVEGDPVQLQQVLVNLIRNACDAADGEPVTIRITSRACSEGVEIGVTDSGPGIDPAILPVIFDSFTSSKPGGMGVGLSICRTIVEAHGGRISARNGPHGATISFTLPAA